MTGSLLVAPRPAQSPAHRTAPRLRRLDYEPPARARTPEAARRPTPAGPRAAAAAVARPGPTTPGSPEYQEAQRAIARLLRTALEVFDGRRPATHLAGQATPSVLRYWRVAAEQRRRRAPAQFARMHLCLPRPGVAEVAVTCAVDGRARALAARFERAGPDWRCTAVRLG